MLLAAGPFVSWNSGRFFRGSACDLYTSLPVEFFFLRNFAARTKTLNQIIYAMQEEGRRKIDFQNFIDTLLFLFGNDR